MLYEERDREQKYCYSFSNEPFNQHVNYKSIEIEHNYFYKSNFFDHLHKLAFLFICTFDILMLKEYFNEQG